MTAPKRTSMISKATIDRLPLYFRTLRLVQDEGIDVISSDELGRRLGITPEHTAAVAEALEARELIKINVLQNCLDDPREIAEVLAERTNSQVVQVIGKKIVLYKEGKKEKKKIQLPK